tara:strand:- start:1230 stop:1382 length:153 start_codon:yes stop_codon:yes gene_type:complete
MQNIDLQALSISEDVKMTRIYFVAQVNFFGTNNDDLEDNSDEISLEDYEG